MSNQLQSHFHASWGFGCHMSPLPVSVVSNEFVSYTVQPYKCFNLVVFFLFSSFFSSWLPCTSLRYENQLQFAWKTKTITLSNMHALVSSFLLGDGVQTFQMIWHSHVNWPAAFSTTSWWNSYLVWILRPRTRCTPGSETLVCCRSCRSRRCTDLLDSPPGCRSCPLHGLAAVNIHKYTQRNEGSLAFIA